MLDGDLFDKLAQIAQILRKNPKPFGGIQACFEIMIWLFTHEFTACSYGGLLSASTSYSGSCNLCIQCQMLADLHGKYL